MRKARGLRGWTAKELAERAGVSLQLVKMVETGTRPLTDRTAASLYDALGFTPQEVPFNTRELVEKAEESPAQELCLGYVKIGDVIYFNSVENWFDEDGIFAGDYVILNSFFAPMLLKSQQALLG